MSLLAFVLPGMVAASYAVGSSRLCQHGKSYSQSRGKLHERPDIKGFCHAKEIKYTPKIRWGYITNN